MSKPRTRLHVLHLSPVLLTYVLILVHTRPENRQYHKITLIVTRYSLLSRYLIRHATLFLTKLISCHAVCRLLFSAKCDKMAVHGNHKPAMWTNSMAVCLKIINISGTEYLKQITRWFVSIVGQDGILTRELIHCTCSYMYHGPCYWLTAVQMSLKILTMIYALYRTPKMNFSLSLLVSLYPYLNPVETTLTISYVTPTCSAS